MASKVKAIVTTGYGTNCEVEMAHACKVAGADQVDIVHLSDIIDGSTKITDYHFLNLPGGFLDGDNLGAAQAGAHRLRHARIKTTGERLMDQILKFVENGGLILGVCNGFQLMVKTGLLPAISGDYETRLVSLTYNDSARFEDRWVHLKANSASPCIFTKGIDEMELPVRHGEGKFVGLNQDVINELEEKNLIVFKYIHPDTKEPTSEYPYNPNGSELSIAGICDPSGRLMGLMPHPEAFHHFTNHPQWTRKEFGKEEGAGIMLFRNAVNYIRQNIL